jgi:hypothetical protein
MGHAGRDWVSFPFFRAVAAAVIPRRQRTGLISYFPTAVAPWRLVGFRVQAFARAQGHPGKGGVYREAKDGAGIRDGRKKPDMEVITDTESASSQSDERASIRIPAAASGARRVRSLVMWSGGLNSTYALARLLKESEDEIHAHHIHLNAPRDDSKLRSRRCEFEAQAISRLVAPMKYRYRSFEYTESRADLTAFPCFARETTTAMFFAAQLAMSRGFTPFDRLLVGVDDEDPRWRPGTELYALRRMLLNRMLRAVWESEEVPFLYVFHPRPSRADAFAYLGEDLAPLTVSCRHPEAGGLGFADDALRPCNSCAKCHSRAKLEQVSEDEDAA